MEYKNIWENDKSSEITIIFLFTLLWLFSSAIIVGSFTSVSVIVFSFVIVSSVISSTIISVLIVLFVVRFLTLITVCFLLILWLLGYWLTGWVPKIFLDILFRFAEMLISKENLFDVLAFEYLFSNFFIKRDKVFISLISQIFYILKDDSLVFVVDLTQKSFKSMSAFKSDSDFIVEEILYKRCAHLNKKL